MYDEDEDNDGKFPDESPVEVRYPRSKQEEQGDRGTWPWLPGSIVEQCSPDEWYVCVDEPARHVRPPSCQPCQRCRAMWSRRSGRPTRRRSRRGRRGAGGPWPSVFGLSRRRISQLIASVTVENNGHALAGKAA